ncbi:MAG: ECF transporter S component [Candidatus Bathyarchaeia archaeon]
MTAKNVLQIPKTSPAKRTASIAVFTALSVVGSFIHPPSPIQTVAFDSCPGFFSALYFGVFEGFLVSGLGHIVTAVINGFPLGILHIPIALGMALAGAAIGVVNRISRKWGFMPALIIGVLINTALFVVAAPDPPIGIGWAAALSFAPFLLIAAILNAVVAGVAYVLIRGRQRV